MADPPTGPPWDVTRSSATSNDETSSSPVGSYTDTAVLSDLLGDVSPIAPSNVNPIPTPIVVSTEVDHLSTTMDQLSIVSSTEPSAVGRIRDIGNQFIRTITDITSDDAPPVTAIPSIR